MTRSTRANLDPRGALRERLRANRRGALLDEPSDDLRDNIAYRGGALERVMFALPFAMSMALISFVTVWGARLSPALTVLFICGYISYGWVKGIHSGFSALLVGIPLLHAYKDVDWHALGNDSTKKSPVYDRFMGGSGQVYKANEAPTLVGEAEHTWKSGIDGEVKRGLTAKFNDIIHICVIPTYKEPLGTLRKTVGTLAAQTCANERLIVVLATESRDTEAPGKVNELIDEFGPALLGLFYTKHVLAPGEAVGKSSNCAWSVRCVKRDFVEKRGLCPEQIMLTVCDADTYFDTQFMDCLAYNHVQNPKPYNTTYQASETFFPNIWSVPILIRIKAVIDSVGFLGQLASPFSHPFPFAIYSQSLRTSIECGGWDVDIIPEDWHHYLKCWFKKDGDFRVVPIFMVMGNDAIEERTWNEAIKARYIQAKRHAWGAIDLSYIVMNYLDKRDSISFLRMLKLYMHAAEHHISWTLFWFTCMLGGLCSTVANPILETYPFGVGLRSVTVVVFFPMAFACWAIIISEFYIRLFVIHDREHFECNVAPMWWQLLSQVQWMLMPLADMLFGSFAGLEAQFHMAIKPTMKYEVSAKIAKKSGVPPVSPAPAKGGEKSSADASMYHAAISGESPRHTQGSANDGFVGQF
jgi:hypothetical protein|tara:strand:- start:4927 stop:6843 length:1917 start_codon:yes stop_codon:yes gene_type:complete